MKRAKQPPPPDLVAECSVFADMLHVGRRSEIIECPALGIHSAHDTVLAHASGFDPGAHGECWDCDGLMLVHRAGQRHCHCTGDWPCPEAAAEIAAHEANIARWNASGETATSILRELTLRAMAEYLRRFRDVRKPNSFPWHIEPQMRTDDKKGSQWTSDENGTESYISIDMSRTYSTGEMDYQCFFCRKSLHTRLADKRVARAGPILARMYEHTEICAVRMLAGLLEPHAPLPKGKPGL